jgi:hypothetical protein
MDQLQVSGAFQSLGNYTVNGDVDLFYNSDTDTYSLVLSQFFSSNGPDLRVYLSEGAGINNSLNLGALTSTNGRLRYDFPASQFDPAFNYVLIWCEDFSVTFGQARLN